MGLDMYITDSYGEELAYWRKANQIYGWFERVFDGVENLSSYEVSKEILIELVEDCKKVLSLLETSAKKVYVKASDEEIIDLENAYYFYEDVPDEVLEILPPTPGFFFGTYEIDAWYQNQLENTVEMLQTLINITNEEDYPIFYSVWY